MSRAKNWVFTINNYTKENVKLLRKLCEHPNSLCEYIVFGYEKAPTTGTHHLQGYLQSKITISRHKCEQLLGDKAWCKAQCARENKKARDYCLKTNQFEEYGKFNEITQGQRTDIEEFRDAILSGATTYDLIMDFPREVANYPKFLQLVKSEMIKHKTKEFRKIHTTVLYGGAGLGKTQSAWAKNPSIYKLNPKEDETLWFDYYDGEDVLLIDDFDGQGISYKYMLQLLDGYQMRLPIKGGFTFAKWKKVIITSQNHPKYWFPLNTHLNDEMNNALFRRIHKIKCFVNSTRKSPYKPPKEVTQNYVITKGRIRPVPLNFKPSLNYIPTNGSWDKKGAGNNIPPHG